jgi:adenylosuccinate synthase
MIKLNKNSANGYVLITQDLGAGSSGKGAINAWLSDKYGFDLATNNYATNAGHFVELDNGIRILNQHICSAFINHNTQIYINAGASIDIMTLLNEIKTIESHGWNIRDRLTIHPFANVITEEDKEYERKTIKSGSTFKGCGAAAARKTMRIPGQKLAKDYDELSPYIKDRTYEINEMISKGAKILIEGSQGVDLDINHAEFPYCTSRQTLPQQLVADAGIPFQAVTNIVANIRTNPIRINNQSAANPNEICYTGNYWDAKEISWQDIAKNAGFETYEEFEKMYGFALMTSVTKKIRRVFEFPKERMKFCHAIVGGLMPNSNVLYSLNFINFIDKNVYGVINKDELMTQKVSKWLQDNLYPIIGYNSLKWIRTGPKHSQIVETE